MCVCVVCGRCRLPWRTNILVIAASQPLAFGIGLSFFFSLELQCLFSDSACGDARLLLARLTLACFCVRFLKRIRLRLVLVMDTSKPTFERTSVCAGSRLSAALDSSSLSSKSDFWFFLGLADSGVLSLLVSPAALSSLSSSASGSSSG